MEQKTVSERIAQMVQYYSKGNKSAFAKAVGISNQSLGEIVGARQSAPSFAALQKMLVTFPEVRMEWLVLGHGTMLQEKAQEPGDPKDEYIGYIGQYPILSGKDNISIPIIAGRYNRPSLDYLRRNLTPSPEEIEKDLPFESMSLPKSLIPEGQYIVFPVGDNTMKPTFVKGDLLLFRLVEKPIWGVESSSITHNYIDQLPVYAVEAWDENMRSLSLGRFTLDNESDTLTCYYDNRDWHPLKTYEPHVKNVWQFEWLISPRSENVVSKQQETINQLQQDLRQSNQVIENLLRQVAAHEHHMAGESSPVLEALLGSVEQHEPVKPAKAPKK